MDTTDLDTTMITRLFTLNVYIDNHYYIIRYYVYKRAYIHRSIGGSLL